MKNQRQSFGTVTDDTKPGGPPSFGIRWRAGGKKHRRRNVATTRKGANQELARISTGLDNGTLAAQARAQIAFSTVAEECLGISEAELSSHTENEQRYRLHIEPHFKQIPLADINAGMLLAFKAKLLKGTYTVKRKIAGKVVDVEKPHGKRTVNQILSLVRKILNHATQDYLAASPVCRIKRGKYMVKIPTTQISPPIETTEEVGRLLNVLRELDTETSRPPLHAYFSILLNSGMRRGEAFGLRKDDIDYNLMQIHIRHSYDGETKGKKQRTVPLHKELVPIIKAHILACPWKGSPLLFPNVDGQMYSEDAKAPQDALHAALKRAGLPRLRVHDMRHVMASHFVMAGGDIFVLSRILGHSSPQITSDFYAHLSPGFLSQQIDRIAFFSEIGTQKGPTPRVLAFEKPAAKEVINE